ncbi:methyltransferase domain-containing protein [Persicitalea sp.]|uniref:methyltransferase domain-containing protein n=1 Tax=Persicitalea sp. TaxID=3100273 RepID=UPI0035941D51
MPRNRRRAKARPFLRQLYEEWYARLIYEMKWLPSGMMIELGAGGGFLKDLAPMVVCTDSLPLPTNDLTFSPVSMPFNAESVSGIFMIDTFCDLPDTRGFLTEANRVLTPGGKIIMIEPACSYWGRLAGFIFDRRKFNLAGGWSDGIDDSSEEINYALAWIVFERDRSVLAKAYPEFSVESITYHTPLRYFLGGGNRFDHELVPFSGFSFFSRADDWLAGVSPHWSTFMTVVVRKSSQLR